MGHGLELLRRLRARLFFAFMNRQPTPTGEAIPVYCYNPHPYAVSGMWECEFNLAHQNWSPYVAEIHMQHEGKPIPCQVEKETSNINLDWRKKISFFAEMAPATLTTFYCFPTIASQQSSQLTSEEAPSNSEPAPSRTSLDFQKHIPLDQTTPAKAADIEHITFEKSAITITTNTLVVSINTHTGLIDTLRIKGSPLCNQNAFCPVVRKDDADPWGSLVHAFGEELGRFRLMTSKEAASWSGTFSQPETKPVQIIEDGPVRTIIEALFVYHNSSIVQHYIISKQSTELQLDIRVYWNEKDAMLKLEVPLSPKEQWQTTAGKLAGAEVLPSDGTEQAFQQWVLAEPVVGDYSMACINKGIYAVDSRDGRLSFSLLRSPAYAALPLEVRPFTLQPRFIPRIDQGERFFSFFFHADNTETLRSSIARQAQIKNEAPYVLSAYPSFQKREQPAGPLSAAITCENPTIICTAFKKQPPRTEYPQSQYLLRLFETTGVSQECIVQIPPFAFSKTVSFQGFEMKTLLFDPIKKTLTEGGGCRTV